MALMDLSKAQDCLRQDVLIAKLPIYGFGNDSIHLILTGRKLILKIGSAFSDFSFFSFNIIHTQKNPFSK